MSDDDVFEARVTERQIEYVEAFAPDMADKGGTGDELIMFNVYGREIFEHG